jgi:hypothetical protein
MPELQLEAIVITLGGIFSRHGGRNGGKFGI